MPFDVIGEHAQEDMRAHAARIPVADRANLEIDGLHRAEGPVDPGEVLVGVYGMIAGQRLPRYAGANDIDAIEPGLGGDLFDLARPAEVAVANVEGEVLGHLLGIDDFTDRKPDLSGGAQG